MSLIIRLRVDFDESCSVGPGKIALLAAIERGGSLSAAARELGMSYRHAWDLLADLNQCFEQPVAESAVGGSRGGGAQLTDAGRKLLQSYRRLQRDSEKLALRLFRGLARTPPRSRTLAQKRRPLRTRRPRLSGPR